MIYICAYNAGENDAIEKMGLLFAAYMSVYNSTGHASLCPTTTATTSTTARRLDAYWNAPGSR